MRKRLLQLATGLLATLLIAAGPAAAQPPPDFVGLAGQEIPVERLAKRAAYLRAYARAGAALVRFPLHWNEIERTPGQYDLTWLDNEVIAAARAGLRLLPVLTHPPDFRSTMPAQGARRGVYPPRRNADMAAFAAMLVRRYGPGGSLWRENPGVFPVAIRSWQIWNEPNLRLYWASGISPRGYVRLLRAVGPAIKAVDPGAEIVAAGLPQSRLGMPFGRFVRRMYQAGVRGAFDTFALHPYAVSYRGMLGAVKSTRRLLDRRGDDDVPIWVTEIGWATSGPDSVFKTTLRGQARRIRATLLGLAKQRTRLRVRGVVYHNWRDAKAPRSRRLDFFGLHTGLLKRSGKKKPGYRAFKSAAKELRE